MNKLVRLVPLAGLVYLILEVAGNGSIGAFPDENTPLVKLETFYRPITQGSSGAASSSPGQHPSWRCSRSRSGHGSAAAICTR